MLYFKYSNLYNKGLLLHLTMFSLYMVESIFINGFKYNGLVIISAIAVICGILVIISKNPIRSLLFLIGLFLTIALYLFALNISFIALSYLLVYVGAISILFLFILMLINVRVSELTTDNSNSVPLSIIIIAIFSLTFSEKNLFYVSNNSLALLLNTNNSNEKYTLVNEENIYEFSNSSLLFIKDTNENVFLVFSCIWDNILGEVSHITSLGNVLYTYQTIGIIIVGLILLLSMVGAISVTAISNSNKS